MGSCKTNSQMILPAASMAVRSSRHTFTAVTEVALATLGGIMAMAIWFAVFVFAETWQYDLLSQWVGCAQQVSHRKDTVTGTGKECHHQR